VLAGTDLGLAGYDADQARGFQRRLLEEARRLPGVTSAAIANSIPLHIDQSRTTAFAEPAREPDIGQSAAVYQVSPGFFRTLEIPLRLGRDFNEFDTARSAQVSVVNRALADQLFGTTDVVGRRFRQGRGGSPVEIVGIVEDGKYAALAEARTAAIFRPVDQWYNTSNLIVVRVSAERSAGPEDLRRLLHQLDPNLPIRLTATGSQLAAFPLLPYRAAVAALGLLGLIASGLLLTGLHALMAYVVARRQREIGIRVALGAGRAGVLRAVLSRVGVILCVGLVAGAVLSLVTGPLVSSLVLGVSPREPFVLAAIVAVLAIIAFASSVGPMRRSLRVEPLTALREE
jgi:ABC-type antimicrobial peptide transport system permease subunit